MINDGYAKSLELILDKSGNWLDRMEWGYLENRHIIRVISCKAINDWSLGDTNQALSIFRNLLKTNPRDNAGVRFYILAINMGLSFDEYEQRFESNERLGIDAWSWFNQNVEKYSEEFEEWMTASEDH